MFYTIYKITNKVNGKIYIGKHKTKDLNDGYMGSGKLIRYAIEKYGTKNFEKEILFQFDNEEDMNAKEVELVSKEFIKEDTNYNICPGGHGGFGYINLHNMNVSAQEQLKRCSDVKKKRDNSAKNSLRLKYQNSKNKKNLITKCSWKFTTGVNPFLGKSHTEEWKLNHSSIMKEKSKGNKNSQYGTMWITNGIENKKIKKDSIIPEGWYKGRKVK